MVILRLAWGALCRGLLARRRGVAQHGGRVAGRLRVVSEADEIRRAEPLVGERSECAPVQSNCAIRRQRLFDREAGELVAEPHAVGLTAQHPGAEALVERAQRVVGERLQQPHLRSLRHDLHGVEHSSSARAEPCDPGEHGVPHAAWAARR